jgi:thiamine biosynthesis lipoprotein
VGYKKLALDCRAGTVELLAEGMKLDLGGIAKGYAGDEVLSVLRKYGITRALVDAGGDVVAGDPPPGKNGWTVALASIEDPDGPADRYLVVKNAAVATSGDAFQHVEIGGVRYSHIVDPRTCLGLTRRSSVTVIAPDGLTADGLASAVSVLGPKRGLELIESMCGTAALVVELHDDKPRWFASRRFPAKSSQR